MNYPPPQWLAWALFGLGWFIAIVLTYHELRMGTSGYKLVGETKRYLRDVRQKALRMCQELNPKRTEMELWVSQTADFIECALGSARRTDFLRSTEGHGDTDLGNPDNNQRFLNAHSNFIGDLADSLQETDMNQSFNLKSLRSKRKSILGKKDSQHQ